MITGWDLSPDRIGILMKITIDRQVSLSEVDARFEIRLRALVNHLQHAAGLHSAQVGYGTRTLIERGHAWVLYRIAIQIHRPPVFDDQLEIVTWHRGVNRFRSYRDIEFYCQGQKIAAAASVWLYINLDKKRILKVPRDVETRYSVETDQALAIDLDGWKPDLGLVPETATTIRTRASDYDPLGHVNNAVYFDYLETLGENVLPAGSRIQQVLMQYNKEIPKTVAEVAVDLKQTDAGYLVKLFSSDTLHAVAELSLAET